MIHLCKDQQMEITVTQGIEPCSKITDFNVKKNFSPAESLLCDGLLFLVQKRLFTQTECSYSEQYTSTKNQC